MSIYVPCPVDMNECYSKCKTANNATFNCARPCDCYGPEQGNPVFNGEQCVSVTCGGFGGIGTANYLKNECYGTLEIGYGVKRAYYLSGSQDDLFYATSSLAAAVETQCNCPMYKTCSFYYDEVKALIGTDDPYPGSAFDSPRVVITIPQGASLPKAEWYNAYSSEGNIFNTTRDVVEGGSGTVIYKWWPYIDYDNDLAIANGLQVWCGGCEDQFAGGACPIQFSLGCAPPYCACCCGCVPCNVNNFGEATCDGGPLPDSFYNLAGNPTMETVVVVAYRWLTGPNASPIWYQHKDTTATSDFPTGTGLFSPVAQGWAALYANNP